MKYIIYKIEINDYIYIGSTKNFTQRKAQHKSNCIYGNDLLLYKTIRENGGWNCCTMVPIKEIEVESKTHAHIAEEATRIEYNAQMNTNRAHITEEERKESQKQYQQTDAYKEYQKQYQQTDAYKESQKQYNQTDARKEYMKQYNKQYQQSDAYKNYKREYEKKSYLAKKAKIVESPKIKVCV